MEGLGNLIGGGLSAIGSLVSGALSSNAIRKYNEGQMNLMHQQNAFNLEQQRAEQQYNSVGSQVQRNIDAGLNPLTGLEQNPTTAVQSADADLKPIDYQGMQNAFNQLGTRTDQYIANLQKQKEIQRLEQDIEYNEYANGVRKSLLDSEDSLKQFDVRHKEYQFSDPDKITEEEKNSLAYQNLLTEREKLIEETNVQRERAKDIRQAREWATKMRPHELAKLISDTESARSSADILAEEAKLAKKYHITPSDDGWKAFIKIALRDPDALSKIASGLIKAGANTGKSILLDLL